VLVVLALVVAAAALGRALSPSPAPAKVSAVKQGTGSKPGASAPFSKRDAPRPADEAAPQKPQIVRVDLSQMPKELVAQLRGYVLPEDRLTFDKSKGKDKGKGKAKGEDPATAALEKRLEALTQEFDDLRAAIHAKKE